MSHFRYLLVVVASLTLVAGQGFASSLEDELLETETILNDSEASVEYSEETAAIMAKEEKLAQAKIAEAKRQQQSAKAALNRANAQIASNEKAVDRARTQQQKAIKDMAKAQADRRKAQAKLKASQAKLQQANTEKENKLRELRAEQKNLAEVRRSQTRAQAKAKQVARLANKTKRDVKNARVRVRKALKAKGRAFTGHRKMISTYRDQLQQTLKELDGLETMIETDRDFDRRMADLGRPNKTRTLSGLNIPRKGKVRKNSCRLRAEPSTKGEVLGSYGRGKKINMTYHNSKWFTFVYGGQKAFIAKECV